MPQRESQQVKLLSKRKNLEAPIIVDRILSAFAFAFSDTYRAVTHNKGIMNGIDAVSIATGQDFRAIEAAAHAMHQEMENTDHLLLFQSHLMGI